MRTYDICGEFNHEFTNVENDEKWKLFGAPQRVMQVIEQQTAVLEKQKDAFVKEMEQAQEEFQESLEALAGTVDGFADFNNIEKYAEIAENVESVNARLKES